jgi:hypothetical protein
VVEGVKVRELYLIVVVGGVADLVEVGIVEGLHPDDAEDVEEKYEQVEELKDDWDDF